MLLIAIYLTIGAFALIAGTVLIISHRKDLFSAQ